MEFKLAFKRLIYLLHSNVFSETLTLILLTWIIWWIPTTVSSWQMEFNLAFEGLNFLLHIKVFCEFLLENLNFHHLYFRNTPFRSITNKIGPI